MVVQTQEVEERIAGADGFPIVISEFSLRSLLRTACVPVAC